jgi:NSS family neurotransmitter:Na+ symporter
MEIMEKQKRGQWASNLGFVLAAAGSAVGLGNIWKFPYLAGRNGGGAFVLVYLIFVVVMGFTVMMAEMTVGRHTGKNPVGAFQSLSKKWGFVGKIGVLNGYIILSYYSVIGGWVLKYMFSYITGGNFGDNTADYFTGFIGEAVSPVIWHLIFMGLTIFIVARGVSGGIEKASKFMMPGLFLLLIVVAVRSCTLPGAAEGLRYFLVPDFSKFNAGVVVAAMGQVFFSLSLGIGVICTYGSYLSKNENLEKNSLYVPGLDTIAAMLSGLAVIPAVFAAFPGAGAENVTAGPSLLFITLPAVFQNMPFGTVFGFLFFLLVAFAALTSSVSLLEVTTAFVSEEFHISRVKAVIGLGAFCAFVGVFVSLSQGAMEINLPIWNASTGVQMVSLLDFFSFITDNILYPLGGLCVCLFVGHVWGTKNAIAEVEQDGKFVFHLKKPWSVFVKYICPVALVVIFLNVFGIITF